MSGVECGDVEDAGGSAQLVDHLGRNVGRGSDQHHGGSRAADPAHVEQLAKIRARLASYLEATGDPRFTGGPVEFDEYPYRARYLR